MTDVVVLSKDRPDLFARCVQHVEGQDVPYQGWLVDNGSDGTTAEIARQHGWEVISPGRNTGFSEGNNLAFDASSGERVLLLNNDAFLHPGALQAMLNHNEGIVGCVTVDDRGIVNHAGGTFKGGGPTHQGRNTTVESRTCHRCGWVTFAVALLHRDVIDTVRMDEGYWYSFEDVDYCLQAAEAGFDIAVCADAVAHHQGEATRDHSNDGPNRQRFHERWPHVRRMVSA